jgi:hypothetical protein
MEIREPCQIVVPMDEEGGFGFGHLRFQEYLVAKKVERWSFDDFREPMKSSWWNWN